MQTKRKQIITNKVRKFFKSKSNLLLIGILLLGAVLRFWNFPYGYTLDGDAIRDASIAYESAKDFYFPLAGAFSSTGPYTFGPWFYISIIISSLIMPTPFTPWLLVGLSSLITVLAMYDIGRMVNSKKLGLILALMTALAPSELMSAMALGNISAVALFSTLTLWAAIRILSIPQAKTYWYLLLGLFLGLSISAHYQSAGLLLMPIVVWLLLKKKNYKGIFLFLLGLFVTFIPILIFNITNNWHTVRGIHEMYISRDRIYVANSWTIYVFKFWPSLITYIFGTPWIISIAIMIVLPLLFVFYMIRKMISRIIILPAVVLLVNFISLRYYWGERTFAYHYFLEPLIIFLVGYAIYKLLSIKPFGKVYFGIAFLVVTVSMGVHDINRQIALMNDINSTYREVAIIKQTFPNNRIEVYKCKEDREPKADAIAYLLKFETMPTDGPVKRIGIQSGSCKYPNTVNYNFITQPDTPEIRTKYYPEIKDAHVVDFSIASPAAIKSALWSEISTEGIYKKSARWY